MQHLLSLASVLAVGSLLGGAIGWAQNAIAPLPAPAAPVTRSATASPGYLGVVCANVNAAEAARLKLASATGVEVLDVDHDAPAGKAGIRAGDVILAINRHAVRDSGELRRMLTDMPPGTAVTLLLSRDGRTESIPLRLVSRAALERDAWSPVLLDPPGDPPGDAPPGYGFTDGLLGVFGPLSSGADLAALGPQLAAYFGSSSGEGLLVERVEVGSPAARAGLRAGDVIVRAGGHRMATLSDWVKLVHAHRGLPLRVIFLRDHKTLAANLLTNRHSSQPSAPRGLVPALHAVSAKN